MRLKVEQEYGSYVGQAGEALKNGNNRTNAIDQTLS